MNTGKKENYLLRDLLKHSSKHSLKVLRIILVMNEFTGSIKESGFYKTSLLTRDNASIHSVLRSV